MGPLCAVCQPTLPASACLPCLYACGGVLHLPVLHASSPICPSAISCWVQWRWALRPRRRHKTLWWLLSWCAAHEGHGHIASAGPTFNAAAAAASGTPAFYSALGPLDQAAACSTWGLAAHPVPSIPLPVPPCFSALPLTSCPAVHLPPLHRRRPRAAAGWLGSRGGGGEGPCSSGCLAARTDGPRRAEGGFH